MTVDLHVSQDHLGSAIEGLAALGAQVFIMQDSASQKCYRILQGDLHISSFQLEYLVKAKSSQNPKIHQSRYQGEEKLDTFFFFFFTCQTSQRSFSCRMDLKECRLTCSKRYRYQRSGYFLYVFDTFQSSHEQYEQIPAGPGYDGGSGA